MGRYDLCRCCAGCTDNTGVLYHDVYGKQGRITRPDIQTSKKGLRFISGFFLFYSAFKTYLVTMNFEYTEEQKAVRGAARDSAVNDLLPGVIERDTHQNFPADQVRKMGELGFMGMMVEPKYNGGGMDTISYVLEMEEISKIDASASVCMSVNNSLVCWGLEKFGSEEQKEKYLKRLAAGSVIGAFCLSEPEA